MEPLERSRSSSYSSINQNTEHKLTESDAKVNKAVESVDLTPPPVHSSRRLYVWSTIARHMPHSVAKFLSRIILNSNIVRQHQVGIVAHMLSSSYMTNIRKEQFQNMTPEQVVKLDRRQLAAMNPDDRKILSDKINALNFGEFVDLCNGAENPVEVLKMRTSSVEEKLENITKDELFVVSDANFKGDMTRAHLIIGDEDIPVVQRSDYKPIQSTKEAAEERRFTKIEAKLKNLMGEEGFAHLQSFAHQGVMPPILTAFYSSFSPGMVSGGIQKFQFDVVDGIAKIQVTVYWKIASEDEWKKDMTSEGKIAKATTETYMTVPLEDLQRGDFSHATAQTVIQS